MRDHYSAVIGGWQPPRCACGHVEGDHVSSRARGLTLRFGVCLVVGCDCREFREFREQVAA